MAANALGGFGMQLGLVVATALYAAMASYPHRDETTPPSLRGMLVATATATSGWTGRVHHHGRAIVVAAATYGGFVALAGTAPSIALCLAMLTCAGAADTISAIFRATVWNQTIPEQMRGRLAGIEMLSYSVGPLGGQVRAGFVADLWSVRGASRAAASPASSGLRRPPRHRAAFLHSASSGTSALRTGGTGNAGALDERPSPSATRRGTSRG